MSRANCPSRPLRQGDNKPPPIAISKSLNAHQKTVSTSGSARSSYRMLLHEKREDPNMIDDENKRRSTLTQLNRGEGRHSLGRAIFHGKRGELRQRYREGQEDQLGALGLAVNMIVLWNTIYMEAILNQLRLEEHQVYEADVARLSPLLHDHINMLGRYSFAMPETVARGELRPLRNPIVDQE